MKKILHTIPTAFVITAFLLGTIVALLPEPVSAMSGSGTEEDPYMIYDVYDLQAMNEDLDAYYELANDIDASETSAWNEYQGFVPIGTVNTPFTGEFYGAGYSISGLYVNRTSGYNGLFGRTEGGGPYSRVVIENLYLEDFYIVAQGNNGVCGMLVGSTDDTEITHVYADGHVSGRFRIGGLIGETHSDTIIRECCTYGTVYGQDYEPGVYSAYIGGLIGWHDDDDWSWVFDSYSRCGVYEVDGPYNGGGGGLIGWSRANTDNCYSTGIVSGSGTNLGGFTGVCGEGIYNDCFWDKETSGWSTSCSGTGKNTSEMKTESTFTDAGWNFDTVWAVDPGVNDGYPFLIQLPPVSPPGESNLIKYAPVLYMHGEEPFFPREISSMLDESDLKNGDGETIISGNITTGNLIAHNEDSYYLDLWDAKPDPFYDVPDPQRFAEYPIVIYGRECEDPDYPNYIVLQYWFFYVYNSWEREYEGELYVGNHHEGDPEMAVIILDKETETPQWLTCARHWGGGLYAWPDVELVGGTHPKIFVGQGSHASYATLGEEGAHFVLKSVSPTEPLFNLAVDVVSDNGTALYPDGMDFSEIVGVEEAEPYELADINQVPLSWWEGWWGERSLPIGWDSPRSPAKLGDKWDNPVKWSLTSSKRDLSACVVGSPVNLHVYDSYGNHVGLNETGGMEAEIPGAYLYLTSAEGEQLMWIYTDEYLRFEIEATDAGDFDFAIGRHIESSNGKEILVAYEDVPITENTTATVELSPENPDYIMEVDFDGDGTVDEYREPDEIIVPEATTLELLPETDSNPVDMTHNLTATVYNQFGYEMEGVAVTWNISGVGSFYGTPEGVTDAGGRADAVITSSFPGTSTVRCEVTGNTSVYDTATNNWTYTPEATTLELLPGTGENPVDTTHNLTATLYDQFGYEMESVAVTWNIESGPGSFVSQDTTTDANGQADAVITSSALGTSTVRCEVTGNTSVYDTATKDWTYLEDFEWGNDGDSLGTDGGNIDWTVETDGSSVAEIDTAQANSGTRSGRFYYDGSSEDVLAYYSQDSPAWRGFYLRKDSNAVAYTITGDGNNVVLIRVAKNEFVQYYDGSWHNVCKISHSAWHFIEFRNIDWVGATYDIYIDNELENSNTPMNASTSYNGITAYYGSNYEGEFWIDDILK